MCVQFGGCKIRPSPENNCELSKMYAYKLPIKINENIQMHKMKDAQMFYKRGGLEMKVITYYLFFPIFRTFTISISSQIRCF